jgi:hypothetical protein
VSAEEEELLGSSGGPPPEEPPKEGNPAEINVERDEKLIKVPVPTIWSMRPGECGMRLSVSGLNSDLVCPPSPPPRSWINFFSICVLCILWIIITPVSTLMKTRCPTAVA